jgi:hydroxyacylglutathione hydrolase
LKAGLAGEGLWAVLPGVTMSLKLHLLPSGPIETNGYLLTDAARREAVLVDAPGEIWALAGPILTAEGCTLSELWLTHGHWDHMQGADEVLKATTAKVSAHPADRTLLEKPEVMAAFLPFSLHLAPVRVDRWVEHGRRFEALGRSWEVRHVPGHCPGSVVYWCEAEGLAFSGDTILMGGIGRTDFPGCGFDQLARSIREQLYTLPDDTVLLPGHGEPTRVGIEKRENEVVRAEP